MSIRHSKSFRFVGYALVVLAVASLGLRVLLEALTANSLATYRSVRLVEWTYGGAQTLLVALGLIGVVGLMARLLRHPRR
jgi:hypothetical protein